MGGNTAVICYRVSPKRPSPSLKLQLLQRHITPASLRYPDYRLDIDTQPRITTGTAASGTDGSFSPKMEHLLALSIDNLSSRSTSKIRKGLRQTEGLLAQICLSCQTSCSPSKPQRTPSGKSVAESPSPLDPLVADPAYLEIFRLQQTFEYNIAAKLLNTLSLLLTTQRTAETQDLITFTLSTLQGMLLLHPPSRKLLAGQANMSLLLELLDPAQYPAPTIIAALLVLLTSIVDKSSNARTFEATDGLVYVSSLLRDQNSDIRTAAEDFVRFYLLSEEPDPPVLYIVASRSPSSDSMMGGVSLPSTPSSRLPSTTTITPSRHQRSPSKIIARTTSDGTPVAMDVTPSRSRMTQMHSRSPSKTTRSDGSGRSWTSQPSLRMTRTGAEKRALLAVQLGPMMDIGVFG